MMKRWVLWAVASAIAFGVGADAALNFSAAASLGYDRYPGGADIIVSWGKIMFGGFLAGVALGLVATFIWWSSRRDSSQILR